MGTQQWPGDQDDSRPTGPADREHRPDERSAASSPRPADSVSPSTAPEDTWDDPEHQLLDDAQLARLLATDPFADDPNMEQVTWIGAGRDATPEEIAILFPHLYLTTRLWDGGGAVAPTPTPSAESVIGDAVPHHPLAPRPIHPGSTPWSATHCAAALDAVDPATLSDDAILDYLHASNRLAAFAQAHELQAVSAFATRRPPLPGETQRTHHQDVSRWAAGELMAVYAISQGAAEQRLDEAETLEQLPATTALYREGLLDALRIRAIYAGLRNVPESLYPLLEPRFLPNASRMNPATLTRKIRRLAEKHNPEALAERHERAVGDRRLWFFPLPDGMAQLTAVLPAVPALALFQSLEAWAERAQQDGEPSTALTPTGRPSRSFNNYLADCFLDLIHQAFLHPGPACTTTGQPWLRHDLPAAARRIAGERHGGGTPEVDSSFQPRIPAKVSVEIPVLTLLGKTEQSGNLVGYGPIPPEQARELAAGASSWQRILTDPEKGTVMTVGRGSYKPPSDMVRLVRLRDPICTGIGCDRPAHSCDIDHTVPFHENRYGPRGELLPKGETSVANLRPRSRYCHRLKDEPMTGWHVEPEGPGTVRTITPTGRVYVHRDEAHEIPAPF